MDIFKKNNDVIEGINDSNYSGKITIPDGIRKIAAEAFANCEGITEVELPESLESIGKFAFYNCRNLKSVTFGSGIQSMGRSAFQNCEALESVELHYGIAEIEPWTFAGCKSLTDVDLPNGIKKIGHQAFADCVSLEHFNTLSSGLFHEDALGYEVFQNVNPKCEIIVPLYFDGKYREAEQWNAFAIKVNDERIFSYNGLRYREVEAGKTVAVTTNKDYVGHADIESEILFKDLDLSLTVCKIETSAFYNNSRLTSVHIPKSVTEIGRGAFAGCSNLEYFTSDNVTDTSYVAINGVLFNHSQDTLLAYPAGNDREVYALPSSVQKIEDYAFSSIHSLHRITFPNKEYTMNETAVFENAKLTDCYAFVQDGATALKSQLSKLKPGFKGIVVDSFVFEGLNYKILTDDNEPTVEVADNKDFVGELKMPDKVKFAGIEYRIVGIRRNAFNGNTKITSVSLSNSIKYVEYGAFYKLTIPMSLPSSLEKIGNYVFASNKFTDLTLPSKLKEIGDCAFQSTTVESRKVTIPSSVDTINGNPFICAGVKEILVNNNAHFEAKNNVLFSKDGLKIIAYPLLKEDKTYTIPEGVTTIGRNFIDNKNLNRLVIPGTVKTLEDGALWSFTNLKALEVQNTTPPAVGKDSIHEMPTNCLVLVPKGCASKYKAAEGWKKYADRIFEESSQPEFAVNNINYKVLSLVDRTVEVAKTPNASGAITIPSNVSYLGFQFTVVGIGEKAFDDSKITSISLPNTIKSVGKDAFYWLAIPMTLPSSLEKVGISAFGRNIFEDLNLPSGLKEIGGSAFSNTKVKSERATIPSSVTAISGNVFYGASIKEIKVNDSNPAYKSINGVLFSKDGRKLTSYPVKKPGDVYSIPSGVTTIEHNQYTNLTRLVIPDSVNKLEDSALWSFPKLKTLELKGTTPPVVGDKSLNGVKSDCVIIVPKGCTAKYKAAEGWKAFANQIFEESSKPEFTVSNINYKVLSLVDRTVEVAKNPNASGAITIPSNVSYLGFQFTVVGIGEKAFDNSKITSISLPDTIESVGGVAFCGIGMGQYPKLKTLELQGTTPPVVGNESLKGMEDCVIIVPKGCAAKYKAAEGWKKYANRIIDETNPEFFVGSIKYKVLSFVDGIVEVAQNPNASGAIAIHATVSYLGFRFTVVGIGEKAFDDSKITSISLPNTIESVGKDAFYCLTISMTLPSSLKKVGISAFGRNIFEDLNLPSGLKEIGDSAFYDTKVKSERATIPSSVTAISGNVFYAASIKEIKVNDSNPAYKSINGVLFSKDGRKLTSYPLKKPGDVYSIPSGVTTIEHNQYTNLTRLVIPDSVNKLEDGALWFFPKLKTLELKGTTPPVVGDKSLNGVKSDCVIIVPKGCAAKYKAASGWKDFASQIREA